MGLERKILEELKRFNEINGYILKEQGGELPPPADATADAGAPPADPAVGAPPTDAEAPPTDAGAPPTEGGADEIPEPVDVENDPDVEEVGKEGGEGDEDTEEIDITDLVTAQQEIKSKQEEFMDSIFTKLDDLTSKLASMDKILKWD